MSENDEYDINIIYDEWETYDGAKGIWNSSKNLIRKAQKLNEKEFMNNLNNFCNVIGRVFQSVTTSAENYELDKFELTIDISAKGEIRLVGSASSELKGGIKLIFARKISKGEEE